jgi:hypothetical protein
MSVSFNIPVSLEVYKQLTARLEEGQTHDDVIRHLLGVDSIVEPENPVNTPLESLSDKLTKSMLARGNGFISRGLWLPNGTELRARYKQKEYLAYIVDEEWIGEGGELQTSPSAAASAITGTNVNGLRFWEARRPTDKGWRRLDVLAQS